jgi:hypothetical protein
LQNNNQKKGNMPASTKIVVLAAKEKDTKNTVKFAEVPVQGQAPVFGSLYLQKWWAAGAQNVRVTIEAQ